MIIGCSNHRSFQLAFGICTQILACRSHGLPEIAYCRSASVQTSDWQAADAGPFAVRLPAGYQRRDVQGIDSFVGEWVAPGRRVSFDFGPYSGLRDLRVLLDTAGAEAARQVLQAERLCRLEASGQTVVVVYRRDPDGTRRWEAGWLNPTGPNRDLSLGVQASDPAAEGEALAILRSVHLKER